MDIEDALYHCRYKAYTPRQGPSESVYVNKDVAFSPDKLLLERVRLTDLALAPPARRVRVQSGPTAATGLTTRRLHGLDYSPVSVSKPWDPLHPFERARPSRHCSPVAGWNGAILFTAL
jgi:hypothetical protein